MIDRSTCPANFPAGAPLAQCGHVALVEIDGQMAYKYATAWAVTGDTRYGARAREALLSWAGRNTAFGLNHRNGPLEAAWAGAAAARAAELLRFSRYTAWTTRDHDAVVGWLRGVLLPQMDHYEKVITPNALAAGRKNLYGARRRRCRLHPGRAPRARGALLRAAPPAPAGTTRGPSLAPLTPPSAGNCHASVADAKMALGVLTPSPPHPTPHPKGNWHASVADAKMALGVLTDSRRLYDEGVALYRATVRDYFKWGERRRPLRP